MKNKLILTIEEQYYPETPFGKCADIIAYAVGTFNSDVDRTPYSTGKDNWKEYLMQFIKINEDAFNKPKLYADREPTKRQYFLYGYGDNHFFLDDLEGNRMIIVTPTITK